MGERVLCGEAQKGLSTSRNNPKRGMTTSEEAKILVFLMLCPAGLIAAPLIVFGVRARMHPPDRRRLALASMVIALWATARAMACLGRPNLSAWDGLPFLGVAVFCFAAALLIRPPYLPNRSMTQTANAAGTARDMGQLLMPAGWVLILALSNRIGDGRLSNIEEMALWSLGVGLFVIGAARSGAHNAATRRRQNPEEWLFLLVVVIWALFVRFMRLGSALPVLFGDEAPFAVDALRVSRGGHVSVFMPGHQGHPWLFPVIQAPFISMLGRTLLAVRIIPALVGTLTVPAVYGMARVMFNRRVAAVAALFLAGYPVHIHFSRIGINNIIDPLFGVLCFTLLWHGLRRDSRLAFALAGVALALSQHFYSGGRLFLVLMVGLLLYLAVLRRDILRARGRGLLIMLAATAITVWPTFSYLYRTHLPLIYRARLTSIIAATQGDSLLESAIASGEVGKFLSSQLRQSLLGYIHTPDRFHFYAGHTAMLLPAAAVLFLLGVMWAAWRWWRPAEGLLLAWVLLTALLGGAMMRKTPGYARYIVATPALAVLVGLGVVRTTDYLARRIAPRLGRQRWLDWLVLSAVAILAFAGVRYYFVRHLEDLMDNMKPDTWEIQDIRLRIMQLDPEAHVHIIGDVHMHGRSVIHYFDGDRVVIHHPESPVEWGFIETPEPGPHVFFVAPKQIEDLFLLQERLPDGTLKPPPYVLRGGLAYPTYEVVVQSDTETQDRKEAPP